MPGMGAETLLDVDVKSPCALDISFPSLQSTQLESGTGNDSHEPWTSGAGERESCLKDKAGLAHSPMVELG